MRDLIERQEIVTMPHAADDTPRTRRPIGVLLASLLVLLLATGCSDGPAAVDPPAVPDAAAETRTVPPTDARARTDAAGAAGSGGDHGGGSYGAAAGEPAGHDAASHPVALEADAPLPGASLYHLDALWTDHRGEPLVLEDLRGRPVVVVMIYASCETACPVLVRDALRLEAALPEEVHEETRVLLVTFDTENDAPERLAAYVEENGLDDPRWRFAVGDAHATRALAAMLGVRYRPAGNGMFSHSNLITVLGADGVPLARVEGLGMSQEPLVEAIEATLR